MDVGGKWVIIIIISVIRSVMFHNKLANTAEAFIVI